MAVPDWPTTFGVNMVLYDMLYSSWGVQLEHSHRLLGMLVGAFATLMMVGFLLFEPRRGLKGLAVALFVGVCLQGLLGGIRVRENSTLLAMIHGCTAQLVLGGLVAITVLSGRGWIDPPDTRESRVRYGWLAGLAALVAVGIVGGWGVIQRQGSWVIVMVAAAGFLVAIALGILAAGRLLEPAGPVRGTRVVADPASIRRRGLVMLSMVFMQLVLGAWVRHYATGAAVLVHAVFATSVFGHAVAIAARILRRRSELGALVPSARMVGILSGLQLALGTASWWILRPFDGTLRAVWPAQAVLRVLHQGLGALLLAAAVVLVIRSYQSLRFLNPKGASPVIATDRPLEAVA
jgi:heme A synthase